MNKYIVSALIGTAIGALILMEGEIDEQRKVVTVTAYTSRVAETDKTPLLPYCEQLGELQLDEDGFNPAERAIAVSKDLMRDHNLKCGTVVYITGLNGAWVVKDKLNDRIKNTVDIWYGKDRTSAKRFGRRNLEIAWGGY